MSILRYDITTNDWVIFAPERAKRPRDQTQKPSQTIHSEPGSLCPFCPGNEAHAGPEIYALRAATAPNQAGWSVRVVANKFPALRIEEDTHRIEEGPLFRFMGGCGAHEVIIETPNHNHFLGEQPVEQVERVLRVLQARHNDLMRDNRFQAIILFKNHGEGSGTSLQHPHWQLIATPVVPRLLRLKHTVAADYFDQTGECLYCALLTAELAAGKRVIASNDHYVAISPYAAHLPFETWIMPRKYQASFGAAEPDHLIYLAALLKTVLLKMFVGLENPDFNLTINVAPRGDDGKEYFLWHVQIRPRLAASAGFELGSGMSINTVMPETAAAFLREVTVT